ncbi:MAG: diguanylate cyclase [Alcaligenaceae bacterium]|nr:diguanylate cyclase [Alcaligenaceae bacterium]
MKKNPLKLKLPILNLGRLIVFLTIVTGLVMMINTFIASYQRQQIILLESRLELNHAYATKIAQSTDRFLANALQQLNVSAKRLGQQFNRQTQTEEVERLYRQTNDFSATGVIDNTGNLKAGSTGRSGTTGIPLNSAGVKLALNRKAPTISPPYHNHNGQLTIAISQPIFDPQGNYLGFVSGAIYLGQANSLDDILGHHYYSDTSYVYAVDEQRRLLYHPARERVGSIVGENKVIDLVLHGLTGYQRVINSQGRDMLAGYAPVAATGWGVVAQSPTEQITEPLASNMLDLILDTSFPALAILILAWWVARLIATPLTELALRARELHTTNPNHSLHSIRSWYFEARQLKRALMQSQASFHHQIDKLNETAQTDPLTGLLNRRGLADAVNILTQNEHAFGLIAIDIDHFKQVNDTYGHNAGDQVLKYLADVMRKHSRQEDILCRNGGEEFLMLLPGITLDQAIQAAERLRAFVANQDNIPGCHRLTLSLGVTHWSPDSNESIDTALKQADEALYKAKETGRNRVNVCYSS